MIGISGGGQQVWGAARKQNNLTGRNLMHLTIVLHATGTLNNQMKLGVCTLINVDRPGRTEFVEEVDAAGQTDQAQNIAQRVVHNFLLSGDSKQIGWPVMLLASVHNRVCGRWVGFDRRPVIHQRGYVDAGCRTAPTTNSGTPLCLRLPNAQFLLHVSHWPR